MERTVTLEQMLAAREARQQRIHEALSRAPLVSFSMNIPGPVKTSPLIRRAFREGQRKLRAALEREGLDFALLHETQDDTGCEALLAAACDTMQLKRICADIEDADALGRLFDMDVIGGDGIKIDRSEIGREERGCMVCGAPGRGCAARRLHSVDELQRETQRRLAEYFAAKDRDSVRMLAAESLLAEVRTTPKPGLVDRANTGSHTDMDLPLFEKSAAALDAFWGECFDIGRAGAADAPEETFHRLREAGLAAEERMLTATGGVNTHKGAIFLLGTLCGALGRLWPCRDARRICEECASMTKAPMEEELERLRALDSVSTAGARLYRTYGMRGARGEIMDGLPGVCAAALPALKDALARGADREQAAAVALLHLIARGTDTNMVKRGGTDGAAWGAQQAKNLLAADPLPSAERLAALDQEFIARNLSPGGCADLLALTLFLHDLESAVF